MYLVSQFNSLPLYFFMYFSNLLCTVSPVNDVTNPRIFIWYELVHFHQDEDVKVFNFIGRTNGIYSYETSIIVRSNIMKQNSDFKGVFHKLRLLQYLC